MPKSTRCGECNTPIKGHARRCTTKAVRVAKKEKKGTKKPSNMDKVLAEMDRVEQLFRNAGR